MSARSSLGCSGQPSLLFEWVQLSHNDEAQPKHLPPSVGVQGQKRPECCPVPAALLRLSQLWGHGHHSDSGDGTGNTLAMRWAGPCCPARKMGIRERGKSSCGCRDGGSSLRWSGLKALGFGTKQSEGSYLANVTLKKGSILVCSHCCIVCG